MGVKNKAFLFAALGIVFFLVMQSPTLFASSTIRGKVIDEDTGEGIEGVEVTVFKGITSMKQTYTDKNGEFFIYGVDPGQIDLMFLPLPPYAMPSYHKSRERYNLARGKNLYVLKKLAIGGVIEGRIYEASTGLPIKDSEIRGIWAQNQLPPDYSIDEDGNYIIEQLEPGIYKLYVRVNGYGARMIKDIEVNKNKSTKIDLPFDKSSPTRITGKVTCISSGRPVANLRVHLNSVNLSTLAYTDANGEYVFCDILPGECEVYVIGEDENEPDISKASKTFLKKRNLTKGRGVTVNIEINCNLLYYFYSKGLRERIPQ